MPQPRRGEAPLTRRAQGLLRARANAKREKALRQVVRKRPQRGWLLKGERGNRAISSYVRRLDAALAW